MTAPGPSPLRSFDHRRFSAGALTEAKGDRRISVCLPARDEEATVGPIVAAVLGALGGRSGLVDEVVVVDDGSSDRTAAEARAGGARVVAASTTLPEHGPGPGKGQALWKALHVAEGDVVVFLDADLRHFGPHFVVGLLGPLLLHDDVGFVKAAYARPGEGGVGRGGRVTELVARPLVALLFPHLAGIAQPLAGECAGRREVLEAVPFVDGYGVDLALLVDVAGRFGVSCLAQVDLGERVHRNRPLEELAPQAAVVIETALRRAGVGLASTAATKERPPLADVARGRRAATPVRGAQARP